MERFFKTYPLSILITVAIIFLSLFNPPETKIDDIKFIDKIAHFCMYGGLELVIWIEYVRRHKEPYSKLHVLVVILLPIMLGGLMEIAQSTMTVYRGGDWGDFIADAVGVLAGAATGWVLTKSFLRKR